MYISFLAENESIALSLLW